MAALRVSYHRILDKIEHMLPAKLRPLYNHPAGNLNCITRFLIGHECVSLQLVSFIKIIVYLMANSSDMVSKIRSYVLNYYPSNFFSRKFVFCKPF